MTGADKKEIISTCRRVDSTGLYIMVFLCLINSCDSETSRLRRIEERLERIENTITNTPNAGAVPRRGSDVGTSPLLAVSESGDK